MSYSYIGNQSKSLEKRIQADANSAHLTANSSGVYANAAYGAANVADQRAVTSGVYANSSYIHANSAFDFANVVNVFTQSAYDFANTLSSGSAIDTYVREHANASYVSQNTTGVYANTAYGHANAAYDHANTKFATAGGTISGDTTVSARLTVTGQLNLHTPIINLNPDIGQEDNPTDNAGLRVDRGFQPNVAVLWDETNDIWTFTNDGTNYSKIGSAAAEVYANTAYSAANIADQKAVTSGDYANSAYGAANTADQRAVTSGSYANSSYIHANAVFEVANAFSSDAVTAGVYANNAYEHANASYVSQNTTGVYANAAYGAANVADQRAVTSGVYANAAYIHANNAYDFANIVDNEAFLTGLYANAAYGQANSADQRAISAGVYANAAFLTQNTTAIYANAAFDYANTKLAAAGGTISGDVNITGNLSVSGDVTYINSNQLNIGDNIVNLNADIDQVANPTENAGIQVDRGFAANVLILWNEVDDVWQFTNDGTNYSNIGSSASQVYANGAYLHANASYTSQNTTGTYANTGYEHANAAYVSQNTTGLYANSAYLHANASYVSQNTTGVYANTGYEHANAAYVSQNTTGLYANSAYTSQNTTGVYANAAFDYANTRFASAGGTVSGDVTITGNLTVSGTEAVLSVPNLSVEDNIIDIAAETTGTPTVNAGLRVNRGDETPVQFRWNESKDKWEFSTDGLTYSNVASEAAEFYANAAFSAANNALVAGGQIAGGYANSAFQAANSAGSYANSSYLHVNAVFGIVNTFTTEVTTAGGYANSAFNVANSASSYANGSFAAANVADQKAVTSGDYANSAYGAANTADQRAVTSGDYANSSFGVANTANQQSLTSGDYANSSFGVANTANQQSLTSGSYANSAYSQANIANQIAITSGDYANSAYALTNATSDYVQSAFDQANNTVSIGLNIEYESFTGDGTTTFFAYSISEPESKNYTIVTIEGITQLKDSYEISGGGLVFNEPPATNSRIDYTVMQSQPNQIWRDLKINAAFNQANTGNLNAVAAYNHANAAYDYANTITYGGSFEVSMIVDNFVGDGNTSTFTLSTTPVGENYVMVSIEGVFQLRSSYDINNQFITFVEPPATNNRIEVTTFTSAQLEVEFSAANIANNALNVASFAANTANSASANTAQIPFAYRQANSSYIHANSAHRVANAASSYANGAFVVANSASVYANAAFDAANNATDSWVRDAANSASSYANSSFVVANTSDQKAVSAGVYANAAFNAANNATDSWVRDAANSASSYANSAYSEANNKLDLTGGTISGDLSVTGNLIVTGNTISHSANDFIVNDPLILLANNNPGNTLDLGFIAHYVEDSNVKHTGLVRDVSDDKWYLFDNYLPHIQETNILDTSNSSFRIANLTANLITDVLVVRGYDVLNHTNLSFSVANSSSVYANAGYNQANSASVNAASAGVYANAAFALANSAASGSVDSFARDSANSASSYANSGYGQANTANTLAQAAYDAANNAVDTWVRDAANSGSSYANSAFDTANSSGVYANAAFNAANNATDSWVRDAANSASSYANSGFGKANTADQRALTTGIYANSAYALSNTANSSAQAAFDVANTNNQSITTTGVYANAAYTQANSSLTVATGADGKATSAGIYANGAFSKANDAYNIASAISANGSFALSVVLDTFVGDGTTTTFELSTTPANENYTSITIEGITQLKSSYSLSGANVVFTEPPENNDRIDVTIFTSANQDFSVAASYANSAFEVANTPSHVANSASVYANGAYIHANAAFEDANTRLSATGGVISGDLSITGNLIILGNTVTHSANDFIVADPIILIANNNPANLLDVGFVAHYVEDSNTKHTGLIRDSSANIWYLFDNYLPHVQETNILDVSNTSFRVSNLTANLITDKIVLRGYDPLSHTNVSFDVANAASVYANAAFDAANNAAAGSVDAYARNTANSASSYANGAYSQANSNYTSAVTQLVITTPVFNYNIDQYSGDNPTIYVTAGETIAFDLNQSASHPFAIRVSNGGSNYNTGLTHVADDGTVSTGSNAQNKVSGKLYWKIPFELVGLTYVYQCTNHASMVGNIVIQPPASFVASNTQLAFGAANSAGVYANASFESSNGKLSLTGGTLSGNLVVGGNVVPTTDNEHFLGSSEKRWHSLFVGPGSVDIDGIVLSNTGGNLIIDGANDLQINVGGTVVALYDKIQEVSNTSNTAGDDSAAASSYANAAYAQANTGNVTAQAAFDEANTAYLTAIVAYNWGNHANAGYANSSNLAIVSDYANSAYTQANTPSHVANSASVYANAAYDYANTISGGAAIDNVARTSANSASVYANAAFDAANNATDSWVRDAANSASSYANSAFGVANNSATITYVDNAIANLVNSAPVTLDTLNELAIALNNDPNFAATIATNIGIIGDYANSAYLQANTPSTTANSASVYANAAFEAANNAVDTWVRDAANSASSYANSGYGQANTANTLAQAAYDAANNATDSWVRDAANSASSYANSGYSLANTANTLAQTAYDAANNATDSWVRDASNSASSYANSAYGVANTANSTAESAVILAQAAFDQANVGGSSEDTFARVQANSAFNAANSASIYSNAAFEKANTIEGALSGGTFELSVQHDSFVADGTSNTFTISTTPINEDYLLISINGVVQHKSSYNVSTANIIFNEPPETDDAIDVVIFKSANSSTALAFDTANAAFNQANTANTTAQAAYDAANNAVDTWVRDAANSASSYANSGYGQANTANTLAQAAYDAANNATDSWVRDAANSASSYANSGFSVANTANTLAQAAYDAANNATDSWVRDAANSASSYANSGFNTANSSGVYANAAFEAANNAVDTWVRDAANSGSSYANSSYIHANAAFDYANTLVVGGSFALSLNHDTFTADGTSNTFTLSSEPINENYTLITLDGVVQHKSAYNIVSSNIVFSGTPDANTLIDVMIFSSANASYQEAYDHANAAYDAANNATDSWVRDAANSASSYANSGYAQANTGNVTAQAAFDEANTAYLTAIVAYNWGNHANAGYSTITYVDNSIANLVNSAPVTLDTLNELAAALNNDPSFATTIATNIGIIGTYANAAYLQANTPSATANSASVYANAAFNAANNAVDTWVRDASNSASSYANSGYDQANTANTLAQAAYDAANNATDSWVRDAANSGSSYANSSYIHANAAFDYANTLVSGGSFALSVIHDSFVADGTSNTYTLSTEPVGENYTLITFDGVVQHKSTYNVVSSNVEFTTVPDTNTEIDIMIFTGANVSYQAAYDHANAAYETANNATDSWVRDAANSASSYANSAYNSSNTNSSTINIVGAYANAAFDLANVGLNVQAGGTITGDISITGNLSVTGCTATLTVTTLRTADHIIDVGYGTTGAPTQNAGIRVFRGDENPVQLRWVESDNYWEYSNDGTNYIKFGSFSDGVYANAAYAEANLRATTTYVDNAIANLVNSAPSTLDTLNELATALNNDPSFATTTITLIGETRLHANAAFDAANNAVDTWVRDAANSGSSYANSAFDTANSSGVYANAAYSHANTANTLAQAAYDAANTGGGATITFGTNPPASGNVAGDSWIDSDTGVKYTYINDADSGQWVELGTVGLQGPVANNTATTGKAIAMAIVFGG